MRYEARGYRKPRGNAPVQISNDQSLFNGQWGCWGGLAQGARISPSQVVNQIIWNTEVGGFSGAGVKKYAAKNNLSLEQAIRNSIEAVNEGYLEYEITMLDGGRNCHVTFNNLSNKRRQRTMWILFVLRCWFQYDFQGYGASWYLEKCNTTLTLREVILYTQVITTSYSPFNRHQGCLFGYSSDGGNAAYLGHMSMTEWRRILKGGYYSDTVSSAQELWSEGGGYKSNQRVQRTANSYPRDYNGEFNRFNSGRHDSVKSVMQIFKEFKSHDNTRLTEEQMQLFIRYVKYRKK